MRSLAVVAVAILFTIPASAQSLGVGFRVGTTGPGVNIGFSGGEKIGVRLGGSYLTYSDAFDLTDPEDDVQVQADADAKVGAASALVDWHPTGGGFRITAGLYVNLFDVSAAGTPIEPYCLGTGTASDCDGKLFQPDRLGSLSGGVSYDQSIQPYIGLGFGKLAGGSDHWVLLIDAGALYTGPPTLQLDATGLLAPTASSAQVERLNAGIESFTWYPVFSLGFGYRL